MDIHFTRVVIAVSYRAWIPILIVVALGVWKVGKLLAMRR
jgi:hypothetical protein